MSEELPALSPEEIQIDLPSRLRIRQRLGQVSTSQAFKRRFVPGFTRLAALPEPLTASGFADTMGTRLEEYADNTMAGITASAYTKGEKIIDAIIEDSEQNAAAHVAWNAKLAAQQEAGEQQIRRPRPSQL